MGGRQFEAEAGVGDPGVFAEAQDDADLLGFDGEDHVADEHEGEDGEDRDGDDAERRSPLGDLAQVDGPGFRV
jgi:hypothetical protein